MRLARIALDGHCDALIEPAGQRQVRHGGMAEFVCQDRLGDAAFCRHTDYMDRSFGNAHSCRGGRFAVRIEVEDVSVVIIQITEDENRRLPVPLRPHNVRQSGGEEAPYRFTEFKRGPFSGRWIIGKEHELARLPHAIGTAEIGLEEMEPLTLGLHPAGIDIRLAEVLAQVFVDSVPIDAGQSIHL